MTQDEKKETLKEIAERLFNQPYGGIISVSSFLKGAEYQENFTFTNEEVIDIIQKRLLSIGIFSSYTATEIWFNQYKK